MKAIGFIVLLFMANLSFGQVSLNETVHKNKNGETRVEGTDPLGAQVAVVYNKDQVKIYQERTLNGETTFAYFNAGAVVEYSTIVKPALVSSDVRVNNTDEP